MFVCRCTGRELEKPFLVTVKSIHISDSLHHILKPSRVSKEESNKSYV